MKIHYIITAYHRLGQLERLVNRLDNDSNTFSLHIDKGASDEYFDAAREVFVARPNVHFLPRRRFQWGDATLLNVFLDALAMIEAQDIAYDYVLTLSGQDYPLMTNRGIAARLAEFDGKALIEYFELPSPHWDNEAEGGMRRISQRHAWFGIRRSAIPRNQMTRLLRRLVKPYLESGRKLPLGYKPYGGSAWFCLPTEAVRYLNKFVQTDEGQKLVQFYQTVLLPEEGFFQTVLLNSPLKDSVVNDNLRHIEWTKGQRSPRLLTSEDVPRLLESDKLFGRKFDMEADTQVLDILDAHVRVRQQ